MHLVHRELACDGIVYQCRYEKNERDELINIFVTKELTRLAQTPRVNEQSLWAQELNFLSIIALINGGTSLIQGSL